MEKEVDAAVMAVINEKRLSGVKLTPVEIIAKMGVFDARSQSAASAWLASGDNVIVTLWAELVCIGADGRWFYLESLDSQRRIGGGTRSPAQVQRAKDRMQLLRQSLERGHAVRAVLQANRVDILAAESDKAAKVAVRVPDDQEWHVADWDADGKIAVLVRGERGWMPSAEDLAAARSKGGVPEATPPAPAAPSSEADVQEAAMAYLMGHFAGYGYVPTDVRADAPGYDIEVRDKKGKVLIQLTVKGLGGPVRSFALSPQERAAADRGDPWRLVVVNDAGTPEVQHKIHKAAEVDGLPTLQKAS